MARRTRQGNKDQPGKTRARGQGEGTNHARDEGRPRCRPSRASQITGSAAASVPSRNCSAPELMPETMAWVRVSTFIREPLLSFLVDVLSSGLHNRNDWPCLAILRPDHRDGGAEISQVAAQAAARFAG